MAAKPMNGNLEQEFALSDPKGFLKRYGGGVILDEIQRAPTLLSYIQVIVDANETRRADLF
jgi:hypothetical protein